MFYVSELNLKGKGPLSRLWQACHYPGKITKKVIETFDYQEGYDAIMAPDNDRVWALRLNGQLLLGYVRIHGLKTSLLQDHIKLASDRFKVRFSNPNSASVDLDMSKAAKGRSEAKRNEDLQMTNMDLDLMLDIPDEVPEYLRSEEWEMSQSQDGRHPAPSPGGISAISSRRSASHINLPTANHRMSGSSAYTAEDDSMYDDMLEPGGEMPDALAAYENHFSAKGSSNVGDSSGAPGEGEYDNYDFAPPDMEYDVQGNMEEDEGPGPAKSKKAIDRPAKRARKSGARIEIETTIPKDECRKWVSDAQWVKDHLCKPRRKIGEPKPVSALQRLSMPIAKGHGTRLLAMFERVSYRVRADPRKQAAEDESVSERAAAEGDEADQGVWGAMDGYEYDGGYDHPEVDYGADHMSDDAGGSSATGRESVERMRAGSEERRASRESQGLNNRKSFGMSPDGMPNFEPVTPQSPMGSSAVGSDRSRLQSICEDPDNPLSLADDVYDDGPTFKDSSLKEEPESLQSQTKVTSQRFSDHSMLTAREIAKRLPDDDSETTYQSMTENLNVRNKVKVFYSMLILVNENVISAEQEDPYGPILITPTENTAMHNT